MWGICQHLSWPCASSIRHLAEVQSCQRWSSCWLGTARTLCPYLQLQHSLLESWEMWTASPATRFTFWFCSQLYLKYNIDKFFAANHHNISKSQLTFNEITSKKLGGDCDNPLVFFGQTKCRCFSNQSEELLCKIFGFTRPLWECLRVHMGMTAGRRECGERVHNMDRVVNSERENWISQLTKVRKCDMWHVCVCPFYSSTEAEVSRIFWSLCLKPHVVTCGVPAKWELRTAHCQKLETN
jgi:hypothetical protein